MDTSQLKAQTSASGGLDFDGIYATHASYVLRLARRFVSQDDAPDVAQRVWLFAWSALQRNQFDGRAQVRTWLHVITRNAAMSWLRPTFDKTLAHTGVSLDCDRARNVPTPDPTPEQQLLDKERRAILHARINRLSRVRHASVLATLDGYSFKAQARMFGIPVHTAKTRWFRAVEQFRASA